ncbi:hypothetical protein [uncultured Flavobacterium sp.]|uniref:hypothetical protein n=1 Tax=uncultured Flavobacterium sp. TaxID=165435 RepID=UPI0025F83F4C|nr:hypothetical protein [uncultured Flavobacterium sp.]
MKIVKKIESGNVLMGAAVGATGMRPEQYNNFEKLQEISSTGELIQLANHPNATVRCYSYWGLCLDEKLKNSDVVFQILKEHLNDKAEVQTQFGCLGGNEFVSDFFAGLVRPRDYETDIYMYELNGEQNKEIDSLLLLQIEESFAQYNAILSLEETEENYLTIKNLVTQRGKIIALPKLAKYNKIEDIEEILKFYDANLNKEDIDRQLYLAVQNFPNKKFFPLLKEKQEIAFANKKYHDITPELYGAIASYKSQEALELLRLPIQKFDNKTIGEKYSRLLAQVALDHSNSNYDELLWEMWEKHEDINRDSFYYLFQVDSKRSYQNAKKIFGLNAEFIGEKLKFQESDFFEFETLEEIVINLIGNNEKELLPIIINKKILDSDVHHFNIYSKYVRENPQDSYAKSLLDRLKTEWNTYVYIDIVETLLKYNDEKINFEIVSIRKNNKALSENWGGKKLTELLISKGLIKS